MQRIEEAVDEGKKKETMLLLALLVVVATAGIIFTSVYKFGYKIGEDSMLVSMRQDDRGHPFYFPEECDSLSRDRFAFHYNSVSVSDNLKKFDKESYERRHPGDRVCTKDYPVNPGEKILHLYTNTNVLDGNFFKEVE